MIVRCGRCRAELEVAGAGEFLCPACGTRNVVRGGAPPAQDPFGVGGVAGVGSVGGLTIPGGAPRGPVAPDAGASSVNWGTCPDCSFRFAMGEVEKITCPNCRANLERSADGALSRTAS